MNLNFINISILLVVSRLIQIVLSECDLNKKCVRYCCPPGSALLWNINSFSCQKYDLPVKNEYLEKFGDVYGATCPKGDVSSTLDAEQFHILDNGDGLISINNETTITRSINEYCINATLGSTVVSIVVCFHGEIEEPAIYVGEISYMFLLKYITQK